MKFEVLKQSHLKRNIIIGIIGLAIISAGILTFTRAKYRTTQSIKIAEGQINYKVPDFNMVALYIANELGEYVESDTIPTSGYTLNTERSYCGLSNNGEIVKDNTVKLYYESGSMTFSNITKKGTKCYLYFDKESTPLFADLILEGKDIQTRNDFSVVLTDDTTGMIYQTSDNDGTSYYFAGNTNENWVKFAGFYWRIIRINGDGTIRIIYAGEDTGNITNANRTGVTTQINETTYSFNTEKNRSEYVGLQFTQNEQHGNTTNSHILNIIMNWYTTNISSTDREQVDTNTWFCSDRNTRSGDSWNSTGESVYYAAYERLIQSKNPTLQCSNNSDRLTSTSGIGLITVDEVAMAGGVFDTVNQNYYLYTGQIYWTMSPRYFNGSFARVFYVNSDGSFTTGSYGVDNSYGARPVINLKADTKVTGTGTSSDPFIVETN